MSSQPQKHQATFEIPVVLPPELLDLTERLLRLETNLEKEREYYLQNREPLGYSEQQLANHFGISLKSMQKIRGAGKISYTRVAGKIFYSREQIKEYMEREQTKRLK